MCACARGARCNGPTLEVNGGIELSMPGCWSVHGDEGVCKWPRVRRSSEDPLKKRDKGKADVLAA